MPEFRNNGNGNGHGPPDRVPPPESSQINEARCKICQHPQRKAIDRLLAVNTNYVEIVRLFSAPPNEFSRNSAANHGKEHLNYDDAAIRQIIEYEALEAKEDLEEGVRGAFARRVALDIALKRGMDAIIDGDVAVEPRDLIKLIELRDRLDQQTANAQLDEMYVQFNAFKQAVLETCPPEMQQDILVKTRLLIQVGDRPALQAGDDS